MDPPYPYSCLSRAFLGAFLGAFFRGCVFFLLARRLSFLLAGWLGGSLGVGIPAHQTRHCRGPTGTTGHRRRPPDDAATEEKTGQRRPSTREQRQERGNSPEFVDGANQHLPRYHLGVELRVSSPLPVELQRRAAQDTLVAASRTLRARSSGGRCELRVHLDAVKGYRLR